MSSLLLQDEAAGAQRRWLRRPRHEWGVPVVGQAPRALAAVLVACLAAACASASVPSNHSVPPSHLDHVAAAHREYVVCTTALCTPREPMKTRPTALFPSGDGSLYFNGITWRGWGTGTATGTGTAHANN